MAFYAAWMTGGYLISSFVTHAVDVAHEFHVPCDLDLRSSEIFTISVALGVLTGLNVVSISTKIRRIMIYSTLAFVFLRIYSVLLISASQTQVNLLELFFRYHLDASTVG